MVKPQSTFLMPLLANARMVRLFSSDRRLVAVVVLLHLAVVIPLAALLNLWIDEAFTLRTTQGGVMEAVQRALDYELQPPLYYVVLALWRSLGDSAFIARLLSILCTAATVFLAGSLARRYLGHFPPALAAAVVAFNPLTVYAAVEARFYATALLLSALLLLFFHAGYIAGAGSQKGRHRHAATAVAALYTHYFLGFVLAAGGAALLLMGRGQALRKYVASMALVAILFVPLAVITVRQIQSVEATGLRPQTLREGVTTVWNAAWRNTLPLADQEGALAFTRRWTSRLALPLLLIVAVVRRRTPTASVLVPLFLAGVTALFYVAAAVRLGPEFMQLQYTTVLFLPVLLAALALLGYVGGVRTAVCGAIASIFFSAAYLLEAYAPLAKQGDWIRVASYVQRHEEVPEPILVFRSEYALDFGYHYTGGNQLIPIPRAPSERRYDLRDYVLHDEQEIKTALHGRLGTTGRFWLITSQTTPFRGVDVHPEILEAFVEACCIVLRDQTFVASRVRLLETRPRSH